LKNQKLNLKLFVTHEIVGNICNIRLFNSFITTQPPITPGEHK